MEPINIDKILAVNPSISREEMEQIRNMTKALRERGLKPRGYRIAGPSDRRPVKVGYADKSDPRIVNLGSQK